MRNLTRRLDRLERDSAARLRTTRCEHCRAWPSVCWVTIDDAEGTETWGTEQPRECPRCGWVAHLVTFHVVHDWRSVTVPSRGR